MSEKELEKNDNCCGDGKKIDDYLGCTICEPAKEVEDIEAPAEANYEVDSPPEPKAEPDDRYEGML
ncbi:hypothetical protein [Sinanaerobacter chloroacetimidivorans]|jgi:hypothetical protein|uniref:Uncharacterized protein n=1 Tax=Sinanaerobacter chloroacetimidivorans TaxID=2818044 RepID=A0A8J8B151_9FIRM|nr:hypothetical protein [Sinanaerobacter chloroacetimidivorans]MBR0597879.1 hypothetical protein [Sinanaerobacter chloroacetimidivorans]